MAALNPFVIYRGQPGNTTTTLYTVTNTAGLYIIVKNILITNVTASSATISMASVASGGSETDANRFFKDASVPGKTLLDWSGSMVLGQNESLRATASAASTFTVLIHGVKNY